MRVVAIPMVTMLIESAGLRPTRSPMIPKMTPPTGRRPKATPNTASEESRVVVAEPAGKKFLPIATAKKP